MSNEIVGKVYENVIDNVLDKSGWDFEDAGLSQPVIENFKKAWQSKLSNLHIARFPWDPPRPVPELVILPESQHTSKSIQNPIDGNFSQVTKGARTAGIKLEPIEASVPEMYQGAHNGVGFCGAPVIAQKLPGLKYETKSPLQNNGVQVAPREAYRGQSQAKLEAISQLDGIDDVDVAEGRTMVGVHNLHKNIHAPTTITNDVEKSSVGLAHENFTGREIDHLLDKELLETSLAASIRSSHGIPQLDGKDLEEDDTAINSDLDDPEDDYDIDGEQDENEMPQIMLCTFDKVQRTKSKWKCVLKDGVMTLNGLDYVFHKANGEYEW